MAGQAKTGGSDRSCLAFLHGSAQKGGAGHGYPVVDVVTGRALDQTVIQGPGNCYAVGIYPIRIFRIAETAGQSDLSIALVLDRYGVSAVEAESGERAADLVPVWQQTHAVRITDVAVEEGLRESVLSGVLAGYPVIDIRVTIANVRLKEGETTVLGCKIAASSAFRDGCLKADPVLLEPIMTVEGTTPEEYMGDVIGDLNSRRAQIQGSKQRGKAVIITAIVPLAEMQGYVTTLRGFTKGRATSVLLPSHYEIVPQNVQAKIVEERTGIRHR